MENVFTYDVIAGTKSHIPSLQHGPLLPASPAGLNCSVGQAAVLKEGGMVYILGLRLELRLELRLGLGLGLRLRFRLRLRLLGLVTVAAPGSSSIGY